MSASDKYCFLIGKNCDIPTDLQKPSCFISIPFHFQNEMKLIKSTLESLGIEPLIADKKPPQFLFHDVCEKLSKSMFGVFEVTETNENVFMEYGMMVEQGKPAILIYDKTRRKEELSSNMKGILQTRYTSLSEITSKLSETIFTLPEITPPPNGSVLQAILRIYELTKTLEGELEKRGVKVLSCSRSVKFLEDTSEYITYKADIVLELSDGGEDHTFSISPALHGWKHRVGTGFYELPGVHFIKGRVSPGQPILEKMQKIKREIEEILIDTLEKMRQP